jgi:hypothetical protein
MKKYLLIAGESYYPQAGTEDWIACFETRELAESQVEKTVRHKYFSRGPRKGEIKPGTEENFYKIGDSEYNWYEIVDLTEWMDKKPRGIDGKCYKHGLTEFTQPDLNFNSMCKECRDEAIQKFMDDNKDTARPKIAASMGEHIRNMNFISSCPVYNKSELEYLERILSKMSSFEYNIGMLVWNLKEGTSRIDASSDIVNIDRPCLSDIATVGCVLQQAWMIMEEEKRQAVMAIKDRYVITPDKIMGNVEPPSVVGFFAKAMNDFCLNGLSSMSGLRYLVEVFSYVQEAKEANA